MPADAEHGGRHAPAKGIIDPLIDAALELDPRALRYHAMVQTALLLVYHLRKTHQLRFCLTSVRLVLSRLRIRWKRVRQILALRPKMWHKAKGSLKRGFSGACALVILMLDQAILCETPPVCSCYG